FWKPPTVFRLEGEEREAPPSHGHSTGEIVLAWLPYILLVVFVLTWGEAAIKRAIDVFTNGLMPAVLPRSPTVLNGILVPGLHNLVMLVPPVTAAPAPYAAVYT